jgi:hypothetical protein
MARSYHMGIPEHNGQILSITARSHFPGGGAVPCSKDPISASCGAGVVPAAVAASCVAAASTCLV